MTTTITNGQRTSGNRIAASSTLTWTTLATATSSQWANWTSWNFSPRTLTVSIIEDAGSQGARLPLLPLIYQGQLTVQLKVANTVDSTGALISPTTTNMVSGTEYAPVQGRYYQYTITLATDSNLTVPQLVTPDIVFDNTRIQEFLEDVSTATLGGTIDARPITSVIGTVTGLAATAREAGTTYSTGLLRDRVYAIPDDYVFQENAITVNTVSKSNKTIRCFDLNGESIDAVIDIWIQGLPKIVLTPTGVERA